MYISLAKSESPKIFIIYILDSFFHHVKDHLFGLATLHFHIYKHHANVYL